MPKDDSHPVILRRAEVLRRCGLSTSVLYEILNPHSRKYDPTFPRQIQIASTRSVGWVESEVSTWIEAQIAQRDRGDGAMHPATAAAVAASRAERQTAAPVKARRKVTA